MVKKRWKKKGQAAPNIQAPADPVTRSIAISGDMVAVAAGKRFRVVDIRSGDVLHDNVSHGGPVRGLAFSPDGQFLVTCADDKLACVWRVSDWSCVHKLKSGKKATACTFSADSKHVFFSDRFGDVLVATALPAADAVADAPPAAAAADGSADTDGPAAVEASLLLGHLQSIVTSLARCSSSSGQQLLLSTDKDGKVRASVLPADPVKGSYEIHSYCLGHTKFTTSAAAVPAQAAAGSSAQRHLVVSASGDGTIRLWDVDSGQQLSCYVASEQPPPLSFQQQQEEAGGGPEEEQQGQAGGDDGAEGEGSDGEGQQEEQAQGDDKADAAEGDAAAAAANGADKQQGERQGNAATAAAAGGGAGTGKHQGRYHKARETCCAVLCVAVSPDGSTVAAAVEGQQELQILSLSAASGELQLQQKLAFADVANPAAIVFDSQGRLWAVGGVLARETESAHVGVAARDAGSGQWEVVTSAVLPDTVRSALELRVQGEEDKQQQQQEGYYFDGFKKAVYLVEEGGERNKRQRRDLRDIKRLRALVAAKEQQQGEQQQTEQQQEQATV